MSSQNNILKMDDFQTTSFPVDHSSTIYHTSDNNSDNGGSDMNKYVTHEELKITELKLENKIDKLSIGIENIPDKIKLLIQDSEKEQQRQHTETVRWVVGTLIIGIVSTSISLFAVFFS